MLSELARYVTQQQGTEKPFSKNYEKFLKTKTDYFTCTVCEQKLFAH